GRARRKDSRIQYQHVQAAEGTHALLERSTDLGLSRYIAGQPQVTLAAVQRANGRGAIQRHHGGATRQERGYARFADTGSRTRNDCDLTRQDRRRATPTDLGLLEIPVLHVE